MILDPLRFSLVGLMLLVASWTDIRSGRIPNELTLSMIVVGLLLTLVPWQSEGSFGNALMGFLAGAAFTFPFYALRLLGAGDVKLMAALGVFLGWPLIAGITISSLILSAVLAVVIAIVCGVAKQMFANVIQAFLGVLDWKSIDRSSEGVLFVPLTGHRSPFAVAVALAWLSYVVAVEWPVWFG